MGDGVRSIGLVRRAYQRSGWGLVLLGTVHMATTFWAFDALSGAAVWFFGSGIAMALTGVLNLLNDTYGGVANGLRWTCIGTNVAMTAFAVVAGVASRATVGQVVDRLRFGRGSSRPFSHAPSDGGARQQNLSPCSNR